MAGVDKYLIPQVQPPAQSAASTLLGPEFNRASRIGSYGNQPLQLNLPQNQRALANNLGSPDLAPFLAAYPKVAPAYKALQTQRVNQLGTTPYTIPEAKHAIQAAGTERPVTPLPTRTRITDIPGNFATDVTELVHSIPKLPQGIFEQITHLGNLPTQIGQAQARAQTPVQYLGNLAQLPGVNLIPGSFIASQFGTGGAGIGGLTTHPLYTALDVTPYLNKLAEGSRVVQAARGAAEEQAAVARAAGLTEPSTRIRPISTFIRNYQPGVEGGVQMGEKALGTTETVIPGARNLVAPALEPNAIGRAIQAAREVGAETPVGKFISNTFGQEARDIARSNNQAISAMLNRPVSKARSPEEATLLQAHRDAQDIEAKYLAPKSPDFIPEAIRSEATTIAQTRGRNSPEYAALPDNVKEWENAHNAPVEALAAHDIANGDLVQIPFLHGTEIYEKRIGNKILAARDRAEANTQLIKDYYRGEGDYVGEVDPTQFADNPAIQSALAELDRAIPAHDYLAARDAVQTLQSESPFSPLPYTIAKNELRRAGGPAAGLIFAREAVPATVLPRMREEVSKAVQEAITEPLAQRRNLLEDFTKVAPEVQALRLQEAARGQYANIISPTELTKLQNDIAKSWIDLRSSGFNPAFTHGVSPRKAAAPPAVLDYNPSLTSTKSRMWDASGSVNDLSISLTHLAYEHLQKHFTTEYIDQITRDKAINGKVLSDRLSPQIAALQEAQPLLDDKAALDALISRAGYAKFSPEKYLNAAERTSFLAPQEQLYLPKSAVAVLDELKTPKAGLTSSFLKKPMDIFRASVLTLRPQWYLGNAVSGAILTAGQSPDIVSALRLAKYAPDAWALARRPMEERAVKSLRIPENIHFADPDWDALPPRDVAQQSRVEFLSGIKASPQSAGVVLTQFKTGEKLLELQSQIKASLPEGKVGFFDKVKQAGATFNSTADNFWSNMALLQHLDSGLIKGKAREVAVHDAIEGARSVFETWDTLTPGERGIVKSIFPFYGFTRSMLKYVLQYPANHPTRLSILAHLAHAEQEDMDSGLPEQLRALSYFGDVQKDGTIKAFGVGGLNPFQDIGSYASLLGFMTGGQGDLSAITRNVNPALSTALDALGVDPSRGAGQLYPELYFDPATGKMATKTGNLLTQLASNILPQSEIITDIVGANADFNNMLRTNPDGAGRQLLSSAGMPMFFKKVNLPQERMKSEVARFKQQKLDLAQALKTGNPDIANQWPGLQMALDTLAKMPPAERKKYELKAPPGPKETLPSAIRSALPV